MNTSLIAEPSQTKLNRLTYDQVTQYYDEGYCVLENALSESQLELLRSRCMDMIDQYDAEMDRRGVTEMSLHRKGARYFTGHPSLIYPELYDFIFSEVMLDSLRKILGPDVYIAHEQYVVKMAASDSTFAWHQDSGYVGREHDPYVTCWIALDDVHEDNGPVFVLPFSEHPESREIIPHEIVKTPNGGHERVGYHGDKTGLCMTCKAGSIVFFTSRTLHCSGANKSDDMRRVYLIQYGKEPLNRDECALRHGRPVGERKPDPDFLRREFERMKHELKD